MSKVKPEIGMLMAAINKKKFDFDITTLNDDESPCVVGEWVSTGCAALDSIMGGGLPVGRIVEIYGDNSTGKSLIAAQVAALGQEEDDIVVYVDTETAVSRGLVQEVGVDIDNLIYAVPDTIEEVFNLLETIIDTKAAKFPDKRIIFIWDSIAATSVNPELKATYGGATMGAHARTMSQSLRKIVRKISKNRICCLFINQTRERIGILFGDNVATFGGKAVGFYSSIRLELKIDHKIKDLKKHVIGMEARATVVKNKVAVPFKRALLPIYFGHGIDDVEASWSFLRLSEELVNAGAYYSFKSLPAVKKFKKVDWESVYDANYDEIYKIIMNTEIDLTKGSEDDDLTDDEGDDSDDTE